MIIGSLAVAAEAVGPVGGPKREWATRVEIFELSYKGMGSAEEGLENCAGIGVRITLRWVWVTWDSLASEEAATGRVYSAGEWNGTLETDVERMGTRVWIEKESEEPRMWVMGDSAERGRSAIRVG